jgi:hypothetical protein
VVVAEKPRLGAKLSFDAKVGLTLGARRQMG